MTMKKLSIILMALAMLMPEAASAQFASAPAFPGAEGYGRYTTGGSGGKVIHALSSMWVRCAMRWLRRDRALWCLTWLAR